MIEKGLEGLTLKYGDNWHKTQNAMEIHRTVNPIILNKHSCIKLKRECSNRIFNLS